MEFIIHFDVEPPHPRRLLHSEAEEVRTESIEDNFVLVNFILQLVFRKETKRLGRGEG